MSPAMQPPATLCSLRAPPPSLSLLRVCADPGPPGKYYPFKPPIKPESPLGKLLTTKGIKFYSTRAGGGAARRSSPFANGGRRHMSSIPPTMKVA